MFAHISSHYFDPPWPLYTRFYNGAQAELPKHLFLLCLLASGFFNFIRFLGTLLYKRQGTGFNKFCVEKRPKDVHVLACAHGAETGPNDTGK